MDDPSTILRQPDNEPISPGAFAVVGGTVTVGDRVNGTLNTYRGGKKTGHLVAPDTCCSDLLIDADGHYWVLSFGKVREYFRKPGAADLTHVATFAAGDDQPTALIQDGPNILCQQFSGELVLIHGAGPAGPAPRIKMQKMSVTAADDQGFSVEVRTRHAVVDADMLTRTADYYYIEVFDAGGGKWGTVYQFTRTGTLVNTYTLVSPEDKVPSRSVQVAPDGKVYEMVVSNKTTRVYLIPPNSPPVG